MQMLLEKIVAVVPLFLAIAGVMIFLLAANWVLLVRHPELGNERKLPRHLAMLALTLAGLVVVTLALPVSESSRNQVIALIGVLVSGVIAFASTTIVANLMASIMLRVTKPFRTGDFIQVEDHFGRVVERGLLDTEIQTENRELVSLPNTYLVENPINVVRSSGTIISGTLSLGYDVHHSRIENLLIKAALANDLEDPFVQVIELGDHAITYRVCGLLTEVKSILTARSNLYRMILDTLHGDGIEIVSPRFMNQRQLTNEDRLLPNALVEAPTIANGKAEEIVFDKAEQSEQLEVARNLLKDAIQDLESQLKVAEGDAKNHIANTIQIKRQQLDELAHLEKK